MLRTLHIFLRHVTEVTFLFGGVARPDTEKAGSFFLKHYILSWLISGERVTVKLHDHVFLNSDLCSLTYGSLNLQQPV